MHEHSCCDLRIKYHKYTWPRKLLQTTDVRAVGLLGIGNGASTIHGRGKVGWSAALRPHPCDEKGNVEVACLRLMDAAGTRGHTLFSSPWLLLGP